MPDITVWRDLNHGAMSARKSQQQLEIGSLGGPHQKLLSGHCEARRRSKRLGCRRRSFSEQPVLPARYRGQEKT
jgi:hypothetical protein